MGVRLGVCCREVVFPCNVLYSSTQPNPPGWLSGTVQLYGTQHTLKDASVFLLATCRDKFSCCRWQEIQIEERCLPRGVRRHYPGGKVGK